MNRKETERRLEEAAELVSCHLGASDQEWEIKDKLHANKPNELILIFKVEYEENEDELSKRYPCPKCGTECGPDDIHSCETLRCPKCGDVFEPVEDETNGNQVN